MILEFSSHSSFLFAVTRLTIFYFLPRPSRGLAPVIKCRRFLSFFQRYIVRNIPLTWDTSLFRYFWECPVLAGSLKSYPPFWKAREDSQEKDCSFLGNNTFPNLYDALVYERKFKSEYLGRQIYKRLLKREPSIVKLIETRNRSDLSKLYTLSEPSVFFPS